MTPLYEYEPCDGDCKICGGRFTLKRALNDPEVTTCPLCKKRVRKVISVVNPLTKGTSISQAKNAGFKVYKRLGKGEYERQ